MFREVIVRDITKAFESGDFAPLLAHVDENVVWKSASRRQGTTRAGGDYHGRLGVMEATAQIAMAITFHRFKPLEIVQKGPNIWGLFDTVVSSSLAGGSSRELLHYETALRIHFKDERIDEIQSFFDTALLLQFLSAANATTRDGEA